MREMKDSGVEWIGEIPNDWNCTRLRFLCSINTGNRDTVDRNDEGNYSFYVRSPKIERINTYSFDGEAILMAGDGVGAGKVFHYVNGKFDYHQRVYNLHKFKSINPKYLFYYLRENFQKEIEKGNAKSTVDSIRLPMILDFPIAHSEITQQKNIASYLDQKCEKIDFALAQLEKSIEKLKAYKQSVITEAVTKGLDPNVPMKDSGVEWIGDIPKSWKVVRIKNICSLSGRIGWQGLTAKEYKDVGPYLITGVNFRKGKIDWKSCVHITEERYEQATQIQITNGDLLITKDGTIGKVAIVSEMESKASLNSGVMLIRSSNELQFSKKFIYYVLNSKVFWNWFNSTQTGNSTILHLYQESFYNFSFTMPNEKKQSEIANFLDEKCASIDKALEQKQNLIDKLTEYKKSLIYECVTGKVEV